MAGPDEQENFQTSKANYIGTMCETLLAKKFQILWQHPPQTQVMVGIHQRSWQKRYCLQKITLTTESVVGLDLVQLCETQNVIF